MAQNGPWRVDVDREIEHAWARFERRLTRRLRRLPDGRHLVLQTPREEGDDGARPYVQVLSFDDGSARRCEVSSDDLLVPQARLGAAAEELYASLGFSPPSGEPADDAPNWWLHADAADCAQVASTAVRVLREGFGVVHPLLLEGMPPAPPGADGQPSQPGHEDDLEPVDPDTAYPVSNEHELVALVDRTFATLTSDDVVRDEDGDWPVRLQGRTAWVRVLPGQPTIRLFAVLVHDIRWNRVAAREVAILNRDATFLRYVLEGDLLIAELDVDAGPFVPRHLMDAIARFHRATGPTVTDFALRTGGRA
jgi:hypothetical protein